MADNKERKLSASSLNANKEFAVKHFILTILEYAVGLGNIWRFPYLLQKYCPGAFFLAYLFVVPLYGIPLIILEVSVGLRFKSPHYNTWQNVHPALGGIGVASCVIAFVVAINYNIILTWTIIYLLKSFRSELPWTIASCNAENQNCTEGGPAAYFWNNMVSEISSGHIPCPMILMVSWMVVYGTYRLKRNGSIQSNGLLTIVVMSIAYLVLMVCFIRAVTLEGATEGLLFLITPDIWLDALSQQCYTYGIAFGALISIGRICKCTKTSTNLTAVCIGFWNIVTCFAIGIIVYGSLGNIARTTFQNCLLRSADNLSCNLELEMVGEGAGTTLVAFSHLSGKFGDFSWVSAIFIFSTLIVIALHTQSETIIGITDAVNELDLVNKGVPFAGITCVIGWLLGTGIVVHTSNMHLFLLLDTAALMLTLAVFVECTIIAWFFGADRLWEHFHFISGRRQNAVLLILWKWIIPVLTMVIGVSSLMKFFLDSKSFLASHHKKGYMHEEYEKWIEISLVMLLIVIPIIIAIIFAIQPLPVVHANATVQSGDEQCNNQQNQTIYSSDQKKDMHFHIYNSKIVQVGDGCTVIDRFHHSAAAATDNESDNNDWEIVNNPVSS